MMVHKPGKGKVIGEAKEARASNIRHPFYCCVKHIFEDLTSAAKQVRRHRYKEASYE